MAEEKEKEDVPILILPPLVLHPLSNSCVSALLQPPAEVWSAPRASEGGEEEVRIWRGECPLG